MTDYTLEDSIHIAFTTRQFSTGAPFTLAGTPVVSAYEDASLTQITAGITLGVDHDSVTGLNLLTIAATAANGYESGKDYHLVITTGTVDSVSVVGEVVGRFTISRSTISTAGAAVVAVASRVEMDSNSTQLAAIVDDVDEIGAAGAGLTAIPWNASWDAEVQSEVADALNAYDPPTNAEMEARTLAAASYATAANQTTISGFIDTEVAAILAAVNTEIAAIKLQTDALTFTVAGNLDCNVKYVNNVQVTGVGSTADPWGP